MATVISDFEEQPISRTYQYRKVMKPMLERKRRARINRCLDELKELMVGALQSEGENVSKLEKADVLELTVRHLHKLKRQQLLGMTPEVSYADRFKAGFTHCANEVSNYLASVPGVEVSVSARLLAHLGVCLRHMEKASPTTVQLTVATGSYTPPSSPMTASEGPASPVNLSGRYCVMPLPRAGSSLSVCSDSSQASSTSGASSPVWRPW